MTPEDFDKATYTQLANKTPKIDRFQWCRYLNGRVSPNYLTLKKAAKDLEMDVTVLINCIEKRIERKKSKLSCI